MSGLWDVFIAWPMARGDPGEGAKRRKGLKDEGRSSGSELEVSTRGRPRFLLTYFSSPPLAEEQLTRAAGDGARESRSRTVTHGHALDRYVAHTSTHGLKGVRARGPRKLISAGRTGAAGRGAAIADAHGARPRPVVGAPDPESATATRFGPTTRRRARKIARALNFTRFQNRDKPRRTARCQLETGFTRVG